MTKLNWIALLFEKNILFKAGISFILGYSVCFVSPSAATKKCERSIVDFDTRREKTDLLSSERIVFGEDDILELAVEAEDVKQRADQLLSSHGSVEYSHISNKLKYTMNQLLQNKSLTGQKYQFYRKQIEELDHKLTELDFICSNQVKVKSPSIAVWSDAIENPTLLRANTPYPVQFPDGVSYVVVFNQKVVDRFFSPNNIFYDEKIAKELLKTIQKGYVGQKYSSGIKSLHQSGSSAYNTLLEIKTIGKLAGHIRLGGFKGERGNYIYFVYYIIDSDHTKIRVRFTHQLLKIYKEAKSEGIIN